MTLPQAITRKLLRARPLPVPGDAGKEERGRILIIGGSTEIPGALLLSADAALRAGVGKLALAVPATCAMAVAVARPEARVVALAARKAPALLEGRDALIVGPGMEAAQATRWAEAALSQRTDAALLLDAAALEHLWRSPALKRRKRAGAARLCIVTPHVGELAQMSGADAVTIGRDPVAAARQAAAHLGTVVVLKAGAKTIVATAAEKLYRFEARIPGLGTSGSGDVLAGIIGGLLARGTPPADAALWGVFLHAQAGRRLAARIGQIGYHASELAAEVPGLMDELR